MKFYKNSSGLWFIGNNLVIPGSATCRFSDTKVKIMSNGDDDVYYDGEISGLQKEDGTPYVDSSDLFLNVSDFFVKAPFGGGYPIVGSSVTGTQNIELKFNKAVVQSNDIVSTDVFTLNIESVSTNGIGEYIYSFTTGATAPTITWPVECKEAIVISPLKKYLVSFVRISATKVFTFIDEEIM